MPLPPLPPHLLPAKTQEALQVQVHVPVWLHPEELPQQPVSLGQHLCCQLACLGAQAP